MQGEWDSQLAGKMICFGNKIFAIKILNPNLHTDGDTFESVLHSALLFPLAQ